MAILGLMFEKPEMSFPTILFQAPPDCSVSNRGAVISKRRPTAAELSMVSPELGKIRQSKEKMQGNPLLEIPRSPRGPRTPSGKSLQHESRADSTNETEDCSERNEKDSEGIAEQAHRAHHITKEG